MIVVGLTGGIGSGKSTVAQIFTNLGVPVIDADIIARQLTQPDSPAWPHLVAYFGADALTKEGGLDRQKLRSIIFKDKQKKIWLEQLLHPLILQEMEKQIFPLQTPYCIVVIPLLIETGMHTFIDRVLVVDTSKEKQVERLTLRDRASMEDIESIIACQVTPEIRTAAAHDIIHNYGDIEELQVKVLQLHEMYSGLK